VLSGIGDKNFKGQRRSRVGVRELRGGGSRVGVRELRGGGARGVTLGLMNQMEEGRIVGMCARRTTHQGVFKRLVKHKEG